MPSDIVAEIRSVHVVVPDGLNCSWCRSLWPCAPSCAADEIERLGKAIRAVLVRLRNSQHFDGENPTPSSWTCARCMAEYIKTDIQAAGLVVDRSTW